MLKALTLGLVLLSTTLVVVPSASAACEPGTDLNYCTSTLRETTSNLVDRAGDVVDRVKDLPPERCWWSDAGIYCE